MLQPRPIQPLHIQADLISYTVPLKCWPLAIYEVDQSMAQPTDQPQSSWSVDQVQWTWKV